MKLVVTSGLPGDRRAPFEETVALCREAGFEGLDYDLNAESMLRDDWRETFHKNLDMARQGGLEVVYTHLPFWFPREDDAQGWARFDVAMRRAIDLSREIGAQSAVIHPTSAMTREYNREREREKAHRFLAPYAEYARKAGQPLALENMRGPGQRGDPAIQRYLNTADELIQMADALNIGICWDTGHAHISGQNQYESLVKIGSRLLEVHVNDNFAEDDVHIAPFLGTVNWDEVVRGLRAIRYAGHFNCEVACGRLPPPARAGYARCIAGAARTLMAQLS